MNENDDPNDLGSVHDEVRLQLGDDELRIVESYDVQIGIFTQPSKFSLSLGDGGSVKELWNRYPPRTPFKLYIGKVLVQTGFTDTRAAGGTAAGFNITGRDVLQEIHDSYTDVEKTYGRGKHVPFIKEVFAQAGLSAPTIVTSNEANRKAMALGRKLPTPSKAKEQVEIPRPVQIKLGDTYYAFIKRILDRAGLFFFASCDGNYVVTAPDRDQEPLYPVIHGPDGDSGKQASVTDFHISDSTVGRVAKYDVYSRGGGPKKGRERFQDGYPDLEMKAFGYTRKRTFRDWHVQGNADCELMARRKIAEERRRSWQLNFTVVGHTTRGFSGERMVWTPDTMVTVDSDELGRYGNYYLESVGFRRSSSGTTTELHLIRPEDLLFGLEET